MLLMVRLTLDAALVVNRHSRIRFHIWKHMTWNSDDIVGPKMFTKLEDIKMMLKSN